MAHLKNRAGKNSLQVTDAALHRLGFIRAQCRPLINKPPSVTRGFDKDPNM